MAELRHVKGLGELQKFLDEMPAKLERNVMRGGLRAGATVIRNYARSIAPVGPPSSEGIRLYRLYPGALRDSIRVTTGSKGGKVTASVVAGGKNRKTRADVFYAHMVEYGTQAHRIARKGGGWLSFAGFFRRSVNHPGMRPKPFMRPALDAKATDALVAMAEYIKQRLATKHGLDTSDVRIQAD